MRGAANSQGGSERWINVCLSSPSVAAAATCVRLEKGSYMALQSEPINRPSSGCHAGGPPHKDSPYGVTPTHPYTRNFQALHPVAEPVHTAVRLAGLFFFSLFLKQPPPAFANRPWDLIKIFSASTFSRRRGAVRGGGGLRPSQPGSFTPSSLLSVQLSLLLTLPPSLLPPLTLCPPPPFPPSPPHHHPVRHVRRSQHQAERWPAHDLEVRITPIVQAAPTAGISAALIHILKAAVHQNCTNLS